MTQPDPSAQLTAREAAALDELDEQLARAEAAEHQLERARAAVRDGDWHALWAALGIAATQRLPEMHTALDTAAELAAETGLTAEQEIRAEAIADATRCLQGALTRHGDLVAANIVGVAALALAARFEAYIRDGDGEPDPVYCVRCGHSCAHNPPHRLVDSPDGPMCEDEAWCTQVRRADAARKAMGDA